MNVEQNRCDINLIRVSIVANVCCAETQKEKRREIERKRNNAEKIFYFLLRMASIVSDFKPNAQQNREKLMYKTCGSPVQDFSIHYGHGLYLSCEECDEKKYK